MAITVYKKDIKAYLKGHIANNDKWALATLHIVFDNQTKDEKLSEFTSHDNGVGFNGTDSNYLTKLAKVSKKGWKLSAKQMACVRKAMPKYWAQMQAAWESKNRIGMISQIADWKQRQK